MKPNYSATIVACFALAFPTLLHAAAVLDGVDMISQSYDISAQWTERQENYFLGETDITGGYHYSRSDGSPLSASTSTPNAAAVGSSSIGTFSFQEGSSSGPPAVGNGILYEGIMQTQARGVWDFMPLTGSLDLGLNISAYYSKYGTPYGGLTVTLMDMTASASLLRLVNPVNAFPAGGYGDFSSDNYNFAVDPTHTYELSISGYSDSFSYDSTSLDVNAAFGSASPLVSTIPEHSSTFILLGLTFYRLLHPSSNLRH
jgi:hypothetical protein